MAHRPEGFLCIYGFSMFKISAYPADVLDKGKNLFFAERIYMEGIYYRLFSESSLCKS